MDLMVNSLIWQGKLFNIPLQSITNSNEIIILVSIIFAYVTEEFRYTMILENCTDLQEQQILVILLKMK
jgi:hypothetical protein